MDFKILKDNKIPETIDGLRDFIDTVADSIEEKGIKIRWHKNKFWEEYGFYIDSADRKFNIFFGIWFMYWKYSGNPLCLCLDWITPHDFDKKRKFIALSADEKFCYSHLDFEGYPTIGLKEENISIQNLQDFITLIKTTTEALGFNLYFNK